jgi:hypothetical protein
MEAEEVFLKEAAAADLEVEAVRNYLAEAVVDNLKEVEVVG